MSNKLSRHEARRGAFQALFAASFDEKPLEEMISDHAEAEDILLDEYAASVLKKFYDHSAEIDDAIRDHLKDWSMEHLPRTSLAILRIALTEMFYSDEPMVGVAISEAVELAKEYGAEKDYQFINGTLGAIARERENGAAPVC